MAEIILVWNVHPNESAVSEEMSKRLKRELSEVSTFAYLNYIFNERKSGVARRNPTPKHSVFLVCGSKKV